ncbi:hypothetical protein E1286_12975, partial [Nonomuraea terrae]
METLTWEGVALATGPGGDAEAAVRQAYREAGLAEPEQVVVLASPAAGALAAAWLTGGDEMRRAPAASVLGAFAEGSPEQVPAAVESGAGQAPPTAVGGAGQGSAVAVGGVEKASAVADGSVERAPAGAESGAEGGVEAVSALVADPAFQALLGFGDPGRSVRDAVRTRPWERVRAVAYGELGATGWAALWDDTGGRLWPAVDRLVRDIRRGIADLGGEPVRLVTLDAVLGQHDAPWLSAFDGFHDADPAGGPAASGGDGRSDGRSGSGGA